MFKVRIFCREFTIPKQFLFANRNSALGACSCVARIGGVLSLLLKLLKDYVWKPAPMLVMGLASLLAGVLALSFPETVGLDSILDHYELTLI